MADQQQVQRQRQILDDRAKMATYLVHGLRHDGIERPIPAPAAVDL